MISQAWATSAACIGYSDIVDPPEGTPTDEAAAKLICDRCPVVEPCLEAAMAEEGTTDHHGRSGIRGGLAPTQRASLCRRRAFIAALDQEKAQQIERLLRTGLSNPKIAEACDSSTATVRRIRDALGIPPVTDPAPAYATHAEAFAARAIEVEDGHIAWTGTPHIKVGGTRYTANQWAFQYAHGRAPEGRVFTRCGRTGCVAGDHLTDQTMREACGTLGGYAKHHRVGTLPCRPCLNANADRDRRLRNTGTSKVLAA